MARRLPAVIMLATVLGFAASAGAHTALRSSSPAPGAVVAKVPRTVTLTFSGRVARLLGARIVDRTGANVAVGARMDGPRRVVITAEGRTSGVHTVTYRVVVSDGDVQAGRYSFTVRR